MVPRRKPAKKPKVFTKAKKRSILRLLDEIAESNYAVRPKIKRIRGFLLDGDFIQD